MSSINAIVKSVKSVCNGETNWSVTLLPSILAMCTSLRRPGASPIEQTANIINDNAKAGIPAGENADGTPNLINVFTYNICRNVYDNLTKNGVVECVIPAGSLSISGEGGNAGGPVHIEGTNKLPLTIRGWLHS